MIFIILLSLSLYHRSLCNASPSSSFSSRLSLPAARFPTVWINFTSIFFQESTLVAHSRTANTFSSAFNFPDRPSIFLSVGPSVFISSERFELREKCSELAPKLRALLMAGSIFFFSWICEVNFFLSFFGEVGAFFFGNGIVNCCCFSLFLFLVRLDFFLWSSRLYTFVFSRRLGCFGWVFLHFPLRLYY